ncbi:MAG: glycosyl transferase family 2 [Bacteroidetes bacterium]|nr:MAG: glycosyl transferase family 2 [Bacteroidota bacterium]
MIKLSLIIPLYNRPAEIEELLKSLLLQSDPSFEVIIVEDGSSQKSDKIVAAYSEKLNLKYFFKENSGPGLSRNYGAARADGEYLIFLDSDCIIPPHYIAEVQSFLANTYVDAFGGPDRADESFTAIQKAINYSMTSLFTTGGIRGSKKSVEKFHPRSFNMGYSKAVFELTGGFSGMRFGEDIDMSIRLVKAGFCTALIADAYVYHKRRTNFKLFYKQIFNSGLARINLYKRHPSSLKLLHFFPLAFTLAWILAVGSLTIFSFGLFAYLLAPYLLLIFIHATIVNRSLGVGFLALIASFIQLSAYGFGFLKGIWERLIMGRGEIASFTENFYQ